MDMLENILSQEVVHKLGWTLLHSLWQGGVIALLLVVLLRLLRKSSANLRYVISCLGLAVIVLLPVVTFYVVPAPAPISDVESITSSPAPVTEKLYKVYDVDMPIERATEYMQIFPAISWKQRAKNLCTYALPFVVFGWFVGVFALSLWHLGGWAHLQRLRRKKVNQVDISLQGKLHNLAGRLKVTRPVVLMESALVQIPTVVGWLRPLILMPASALAGLSPGQLEALLAHELAHIRRYDYLVNMLQTVVEIVGFYHPAVWWVSHKIRVERENCCDDLAVSVCGDKVGYARALTSMEEARFAKGKLAVASSGGSLSRRIRRLIGTGSTENKRLGYLPVVVSVLLIMALTIPTTLAITAKRENRDSSPNRTIETGSIKATDAYVTATGQKNDYDPKYPAADSGKTAKKAQILFDCEIYEVPADLKFIEDERRKGISGPIMKLLESLESEREKGSAGISIQLGKEYADSLKALSRENEYVKVLAAPKLITLDGKEATVNTTQNVSYTADYENDKGDDKPKPIIKNLPCEMELKVKGEVAKNNTIFTHLRLTQSKPVFATKQDGEGREIQIPIIERSDCTTYLDTRSGESIILGGLRSDEGPSRNLILVITPSIIRPEKGPEQATIEKDVRAVDTDPGRIVEFPDDEHIEAEKAVIQAQIEALEAKLIELRKNYEAEIFNRQSEWWAEMRAFTADVVAAQKSIFDANTALERDFAAVKKIEVEIKNFKLENGENIAKDNGLYNKLKTMMANYDAIKEQIKRDRLKLAKNQKELEEAVARREQYFKYRPRAGTDPNEAQRVINLAKQALELQLYELKGLSSEHTSAKEPESGMEPRYHTVREGETLSSISEKYYGSEDKWQEILNCNRKIITANGIRVGQKLAIPPLKASAKEPESEHEWLSAMAAKYAERGDYAKAIEHIEKAIKLARAEKYYGIGIAIGKEDGLIRISDVLPNTPASGSSFQKGDIIEAVDGISTEGLSLDDVVARIVGPKGTEVTLSVKSRSQDITEKKTFTRQLPLEGSHVLRAYEWRLAAYRSDKTWPQYRRMMEEKKIQKDGATRIFEIRYASAEELAEVLSRVLERRWKGVKDRPTQVVRIIPEPNRNRLIVIASEADIQLIKVLIAELDVLAKRDTVAVALKAIPPTEVKQDAPVESTITKIIKLKHADCESLAQILQQLVSDKQLKIVPDKRTNMLLVAGTESTIQKILSLVAELDIPSREDITATKTSESSKLTPDSPAEDAFYEIIQLKYSDCQRVSEKVVKILSADQQFQLVPLKDANQLIILGSKSAIQQVKALAKEIDVPGSKKELEIQY